MKIYIVTTAGEERGYTRHNEEGIYRDYTAEANRLKESASAHGLETIIYGHDFILGKEFYPKYAKVLDKVSFGFAFKSMCLYDALHNKVKNGDIVFFLDSNHVVVNPDEPIKIAQTYGCYLHDHIWVYYPNKDWTRRDTFVNMGCDEEKYWEAPQLQANTIGFVRNTKNLEFTKEFRECSLNYDIMFGNNEYPNFDSLNQHRHDQSIFSILAVKYNMPYVNRTNNVHLENAFPELNGIEPEKRLDFSYRKEMDNMDNR